MVRSWGGSVMGAHPPAILPPSFPWVECAPPCKLVHHPLDAPPTPCTNPFPCPMSPPWAHTQPTMPQASPQAHGEGPTTPSHPASPSLHTPKIQHGWKGGHSLKKFAGPGGGASQEVPQAHPPSPTHFHRLDSEFCPPHSPRPTHTNCLQGRGGPMRAGERGGTLGTPTRLLLAIVSKSLPTFSS